MYFLAITERAYKQCTPGTMNTLCAQILFSIPLPNKINFGSLEKLMTSSPGEKNNKMSLKHLSVPKVRRCSKSDKDNLTVTMKGLPVTKSGTRGAIKK